jgi:drug/metabolite transporter (DMT)-like permease
MQWKMIAAFAAVYLIWGSTYLAIRYAIESLPPFTMAGGRFLVAGAILYGWSRMRGAPEPSSSQWLAALLGGALLLLIGNGGIVWAEQVISTGLTALLICSEPLWIVVFDWLRPGGRRPGGLVVFGLILGFVGTVMLIAPSSPVENSSISWAGVAAVLLASIAWAIGSLYIRTANLPASPLLSIGMQMLAGGGLLLTTGLITGEWNTFDPVAASARSWLAVIYLLLAGSLVGFTSYVWLMKVTTPARASTYAYVNPVLAVLLGWLFAGEAVTIQMLGAAVVVVCGVALIISSPAPETLTCASETKDSRVAGPPLDEELCLSEFDR